MVRTFVLTTCTASFVSNVFLTLLAYVSLFLFIFHTFIQPILATQGLCSSIASPTLRNRQRTPTAHYITQTFLPCVRNDPRSSGEVTSSLTTNLWKPVQLMLCDTEYDKVTKHESLRVLL